MTDGTERVRRRAEEVREKLADGETVSLLEVFRHLTREECDWIIAEMSRCCPEARVKFRGDT